MVRNKDVERKAIDFAKDYYRSQGYTVKEKSRIGCDLTITKMGGEYPIEVKGRTKIWGFINLSMKEVKVLKNNPNARLFEVI
ncbi:MAG: DUF3883 domain-containing protein, partial [archaeon]|nr:DUF3883 domain-containing protein [archaeon]